MLYSLNETSISHTPRAQRKPNGGWLIRCPAHDDRTPSLSLDTIEGKAVWHCHAGCDNRDVREALLKAGAITPVYDEAPVQPPKPRPKPPTDWMARIWKESQPIEGTPASLRFKERHLEYNEWGALRWHPTRDEMLAQIIAPDGSRATGLHRTIIGTKVRKINGKMGGGAIRLYGYNPRFEGRLGIAEGIETAIAFSMMADPMFRVPMWAVASTSGMQSFEPPAGTKHLTIAADCDGPGLTAAEKLAKRLDIDVTIECPPKHGQDWNDVLIEKAALPTVRP